MWKQMLLICEHYKTCTASKICVNAKEIWLVDSKEHEKLSRELLYNGLNHKYVRHVTQPDVCREHHYIPITKMQLIMWKSLKK